MSGVYIRDMVMPQNCDECPLNSTCGYSLHMPLYHTEKRHDDCPLIEIPEPHGRLIDEKDIVPKDGYIIADGMACIPVKDIANAPTAIPAESEGELWCSAKIVIQEQ